jgi:hypothetical protein
LTALWYAIGVTTALCIAISLVALIHVTSKPGRSGGLGHQLRSEGAALAAPHEYQQDPATPDVCVCRCGLWRSHHIHGGDLWFCACDDCRAYREGTFHA